LGDVNIDEIKGKVISFIILREQVVAIMCSGVSDDEMVKYIKRVLASLEDDES